MLHRTKIMCDKRHNNNIKEHMFSKIRNTSDKKLTIKLLNNTRFSATVNLKLTRDFKIILIMAKAKHTIIYYINSYYKIPHHISEVLFETVYYLHIRSFRQIQKKCLLNFKRCTFTCVLSRSIVCVCVLTYFKIIWRRWFVFYQLD